MKFPRDNFILQPAQFVTLILLCLLYISILLVLLLSKICLFIDMIIVGYNESLAY
jgi:hypothetical protein